MPLEHDQIAFCSDNNILLCKEQGRSAVQGHQKRGSPAGTGVSAWSARYWLSRMTLKACVSTVTCSNGREYAPITASTGWEGIDLAVKEHPGLILLDLRLPDITGLTVLETLHAALSTKSIPIIVVSAISKDDDVIKAMQIGAFDYVVKPITYEDMMRRVKLVFSSEDRQGEAEQAPVLVIEDNAVDGAAMVEQLTGWGYQATWVKTGRGGDRTGFHRRLRRHPDRRASARRERVRGSQGNPRFRAPGHDADCHADGAVGAR